MKQILVDKNFNLYKKGDLPEELADKVLSAFLGRKVLKSDLPISPFSILNASGANFLFLDFDRNTEGFYIPPDENNIRGMVGIRKNSIIERQRFTAAHELCHHIKDNEYKISKQENEEPCEIYANKFASELLMPSNLVAEIVEESKNKSSEFVKKILEISMRFGTSFQASFIKVNKILGLGLSSTEIKEKTRNFKPRKRIESADNYIGYKHTLYSQIINSSLFVKGLDIKTKVRNDYLRYIIENDHKIENGNVKKERISEILTLMRVKDLEEIRSLDLSDDEREVVGQYIMYESIFESKLTDSVDDLVKLHSKFSSCASFPQYGGMFRQVTARIAGTSIKTSDPYMISFDLKNIFECNRIKLDVSNSEYILNAINIHHGITKVHPFIDGNGRTSRALLNHQLLFKDIAPFFVKVNQKKEYHEALQKIDETNDTRLLEICIYKVIIEMYSFLIDSTKIKTQ